MIAIDEFDETIPWSVVEPAAEDIFKVWVNGGELEWAKECWGHFEAAGLTRNETPLMTTATLLRLLSLGRIYEKFCVLAWDEDPDTPIDYMASELPLDDFSLGILAAKDFASGFDIESSPDELKEMALIGASDAQTKEIFECLSKAYGDPIQLYSKMSQTYPSHDDGDEFEVTGTNARALAFVTAGFID
jgi:hypothetical protein